MAGEAATELVSGVPDGYPRERNPAAKKRQVMSRLRARRKKRGGRSPVAKKGK